MASVPVDLSLSKLAGKSWSDIQLLNPDIIKQLERLSSKFNGGAVANIEIFLYLIIAIVFGMILTINTDEYQDLSSVSSCSNIPKNTNIVTYISYIGIIMCTIRIVFSKIFVDISTMASSIWELVLGIVLWLLFLVQMVLAINTSNALNDATKCNSSNADQAKLIANAKSRASKEQNMAMVGFILTTLYTIANGVRIYVVKTSIIPSARMEQADILKNNEFPVKALNVNSQVADAVFGADPNANASDVLDGAKVRV